MPTIGSGLPSDRTTTFVLTRDQLIARAYKTIGTLEKGQVMDAEQLEEGIEALNIIVGEVDASGKWRWTVDESVHVPLVANVSVYDAESQLPGNITELLTVKYRNAAGCDTSVDVYTAERYESIVNKSEAGNPVAVYLTEESNLEERSLYIWRTPSTVQTQSTVESDNVSYRCIRAHTASSLTEPGSGANWKMYWEVGGASLVAWVSGTAYVTTDQLRLTYRRPLYDFNSQNDTPDFPRPWPRMLLYKLAFDLGDIEGIPLDERSLMIEKAKAAYKDIFPSVKNKTTMRHNKAKYF